jgi:DNA repair protein RecO
MTPLLLTEGIILRSVPYRDHDRIATLFTPDTGLMTLMVKRSPSYCAPLHRVEASYNESKSPIKKCEQLSLLNSYNRIRRDLPRIKVACDLLQIVEISQWEERPAPLIYQLLIYYLERLPQEANFTFFGSSFRLKTLHHEGLLQLPLMDRWKLFFNDEEQAQMHCLAYSKNYSDLSSLNLSEEFQSKTITFFETFLKE